MNTLPCPFGAVPNEAWLQVLERLQTVHLGYGQDLELPEDSAALVVEGHLAIEHLGREVANAQAGDVVASSRLVGLPWCDDSARAVEESAVIFVNRDELAMLFAAGNPMGLALEHAAISTLVWRLGALDGQILNLSEGAYEPDDHRVRPGLMARLRRWWEPAKPVEAAVLADNPLFEGVSMTTLTGLVPDLEVVRGDQGTALYEQGGAPLGAWFLVSGHVDVVVQVGPDTFERLGTLSPGDAFGLTSLLEKRAHMATTMCVGPVEALRMPRDRWKDVLRGTSAESAALRMATMRSLSNTVLQARRVADRLVEMYRDQVARQVRELDASGPSMPELPPYKDSGRAASKRFLP
jgi:CRP-like cAMP-binding protein